TDGVRLARERAGVGERVDACPGARARLDAHGGRSRARAGIRRGRRGGRGDGGSITRGGGACARPARVAADAWEQAAGVPAAANLAAAVGPAAGEAWDPVTNRGRQQLRFVAGERAMRVRQDAKWLRRSEFDE